VRMKNPAGQGGDEDHSDATSKGRVGRACRRYGCYAGVTATVTPEIDRATGSLGPLVTLLHLY